MILVQKAIISTLLSNAAIQTALGFSSPKTGGVGEAQDFALGGATYPSINVGINNEKPRPVVEQGTLGHRISDVYVDIHFFSKKQTSTELGALDQLIRQVLDGGQISYTGLAWYMSELDQLVLKERDAESGIWHSVSRYHIVARTL